MLRRTIKVTSFLIAILFLLASLYTFMLGVQLRCYSIEVYNARQSMNLEYRDEVYLEVMEKRQELRDENWYSRMIFDANGCVRLLVFFTEVAVTFVSGTLFILIYEYDKLLRARALARKRAYARRGGR